MEDAATAEISRSQVWQWVREAFRLLEEDGLLETQARRWTRVSVPDPDSAKEIYPLVGALEEIAVSQGTQPTAADLKRLEAANRQLAKARDVVGAMRADARFHELLLRTSGNATLLRIVEDLKAKVRLLESLYFRTDRAAASVDQHAAVIAALRAQDLATAGQRVRENWAHGLAAVLEEMTSAP
jgi:DNA-binding GntR family transcriptional regulator